MARSRQGLRWLRTGIAGLSAMVAICLVASDPAAGDDRWRDRGFREALTIGADLDHSDAVLRRICSRMTRLEGAPPRLPTTRLSEHFVRCDMEPGTPGAVIGLSYSDGRLALVEIRGSDLVAALTSDQRPVDGAVPYAGHDIYPEVALALSRNAPQAWILDPAHLHAHLFLFGNPLLDAAGRRDPEMGLDLLPEGIAPGAALADVEAILADACPVLEAREISPPTLPDGPQVQTQINCFGFEVGGFPRKIEFVFGDTVLDLVWILTGAEEEARLRDALTRAFGPLLAETPDYLIWPDGLALRRDVPEILVASPEIAAFLFETPEDDAKPAE